ncbi:TolC family outer membrane protein [Aquariibacter lacus]|nr:TolC family outer membrane protein [Piscinibacter lacus]
MPFPMPTISGARKRLSCGRIGIGGLLWLGLLANAPAQSLQELHAVAQAYDARTLAARASAEAARHRLDQASALRRPSAAVSASINRSATDAPGRDETIYNTRPNAQLSATQPLINPASTVQIEQAQRNLLVAQTQLEDAEQDLILRLSDAYFAVLAAQDTLTTARQNEAAIGEQLASAQRNFEVGTATITDTREAQSRRDLAIAQRLAAENTLRTAQIALDQLVGREGVQPRPLQQPARLPSLKPGEVEQWAARSESSPAVRRARLALEVAELETRLARSGVQPTLDLIGSYGKSRNTGTAAGTFGVGTTTTASVGLQFNWPVFTGGRVDARVRETVSLSERTRQELEDVRRNLAQTTRQAYFTLLSAEAQVSALEAAEASSRLALEATQVGYRVGVRVNLDVLNAQTQLYTTQANLARARYDVLLGQLRLRQAAGALGADDLGEIAKRLQP